MVKYTVCGVISNSIPFSSRLFIIGEQGIWPCRIEYFLCGTSMCLRISAPQWWAAVLQYYHSIHFDNFMPLNQKCIHRDRHLFKLQHKSNRLNVVVYLYINRIAEFPKQRIISFHDIWNFMWLLYCFRSPQDWLWVFVEYEQNC